MQLIIRDLIYRSPLISNDYLGMSQREETKQAGIDAIKNMEQVLALHK